MKQIVFALLASFTCFSLRAQEIVEAPTANAAASPSATPVLSIVKPPAKEHFHIYLLMGQSNMAGRDTRTLATEKTSPHVLAMTPDGQWIVAKDPLHQKDGRTDPGVGPGMSFALEMLKASPTETIGLVPCAVGATPLRRWTKGKGGDLYDRAVSRAKLAAPTGTIEGVLWHQGESDTTKQTNADSYEARLSQMLQDLRTDLGAPNLPIVVGELGEYLTLKPDKYPFVATVQAALKSIPTKVPHVGYAASTGLVDKGDGLHFDAASQHQMGARYAKAMQELQRK